MKKSVEFGKLSFALYEKAYETKMYQSYYKNEHWDEGKVVAFHNFELSPAANILNYGQGIFEGMKAYRSVKDKVVMFRPGDNAKRFFSGCQKLAIPEISIDKFMGAVKNVVLENEQYIPDSQGGQRSLYLRPVCIGIEPQLGVRAAQEYLFYIYVNPVGPYFDKIGIIKLIVTDKHRSAAHGLGDAKAVGNYPVAMASKREALQQGFQEVLFLDATHNQYVEEAGVANFFALLDDDTLVTPKLGSILPGITRESIIIIARELFGLTVVERDLDIEEVCRQTKECFVCGTGTIITSVSDVNWQGETYNINKNEFQLAHRLYDKLLGIQLQQQEDPFGWVVEF